MTSCPECQGELPEESESGQCPHCGHAWGAHLVGGIGILDVVKVEVGYGAKKSWLEQWGLVERSFKKLQELYTTDGVDNQDARTIVKDFFLHSWHLKDWISADSDISVTNKEVWSLFESEPDLQVCRAMANTAKHHTLKDIDEMTARVSSVVTQPQCQVKIEASTTDGTQSHDALELATSCLLIWRNYLVSRGLLTAQ